MFTPKLRSPRPLGLMASSSLALASGMFGCATSDGAATCLMNETRSCTCESGRAGVATCGPIGVGPCVCDDPEETDLGPGDSDERPADVEIDVGDAVPDSDGPELPSDGSGPDLGHDAGVPTGPEARCQQIAASIVEAGFASEVEVVCDGVFAWLASDTDPDHVKMTGIVGTNEQVPVPAVDFRAPIPLTPTMTDGYGVRDNALGIAVNGVPIYDYTSQGELDPTAPYDPAADVVVQGQLDVCGGHAGRGDDYHYHASPTCLLAQMQNAGPAAIIGWAYDGFPIYGDVNPDGSEIEAGALDLCNGQPDAVYGFRYHTSSGPPYILQCLRGAFDEAILPRVKPLSAAAGGGKPIGTPPPGGVQDLTFIESADGSREMTYRHDGQDYFIRYVPAAEANCYQFDSVTVTHGSDSGVYCRD